MGAALALRMIRGVEGCDQEAHFWLRGAGRLEEVEPLLRRIPEIEIFDVANDDTITRLGRRIPSGTLPRDEWSKFESFFAFRPQPAAMPAQRPGPIALRLQRATREERVAAIVLSIEDWHAYATSAPQVRLQPLRFAVCADRRVVVIGTPLPPLRGEMFVDREGLLVPAGFTFDPDVEPAIVRRLLNLGESDRALFHLDGSYDFIGGESFVAARRGAVRRSSAALASQG